MRLGLEPSVGDTSPVAVYKSDPASDCWRSGIRSAPDVFVDLALVGEAEVVVQRFLVQGCRLAGPAERPLDFKLPDSLVILCCRRTRAPSLAQCHKKNQT